MDKMMTSRRGFVGGALAAGTLAAVGSAMVSATAQADTGVAPDFDYTALHEWLSDQRNFGNAYTPAVFMPGDENAPTDEELVDILRIANSYGHCHMMTGPHFVVIRDAEEQQKIVGGVGATGDGTVTILCLADQCKDQEYHAAPYDEVMHYWQSAYVLDELGQAHALLNMAARTYGYRTKAIGFLDVPNLSYAAGEGDQSKTQYFAAPGNWDILRHENYDIAKYCHGKTTEEPFTHFTLANDQHIELDGNLTLVYAIVMGRIDPDLFETSVTDHAQHGPYYTIMTSYPQDLTQINHNFSFWDTGVDGSQIYEPNPVWEEVTAKFESGEYVAGPGFYIPADEA